VRIIIVTGLSGSGKSTAIHAYEDRGFFCIDNLPVVMIPGLIEAASKSAGAPQAIVLGIDARERTFLSEFQRVAETIREAGHTIEILYLEARDDVLIRRFSETRRRHPLHGLDIGRALALEKELLAPLRAAATTVLDTSEMTIHDLKKQIHALIDRSSDASPLTVTLMSFGFKYGVPLEADLVFDARFLPNPYFVPALNPLTGLDQDVYDYVMSAPEAAELVGRLEDFLRFSLPLYEKEGKAYLTVAVGCTGGRHRSVAAVRALGEFVGRELPRYALSLRHRDKDKKS